MVRQQRRKGKALNIYRAAADVFFIPNRLTAGEERHSERWEARWEDFQRGLRYAYEHKLAGWGRRLYRKDGAFNVSLASSPETNIDVFSDTMPAMYNCFHDSLYLDFDQAKTFQRELDALFGKYVSSRGQQRYMLRISFVPVSEDAEVIL